MASEYPEACKSIKFVDVDFPDLIHQKCSKLFETESLMDLIPDASNRRTRDGIPLSSQRYTAIACDLGNVKRLEELFDVLDLSTSRILFIAEVSMTYMRVEKADAIVAWAARFPYGRQSPLLLFVNRLMFVISSFLSSRAVPTRWSTASVRANNAYPLHQAAQPSASSSTISITGPSKEKISQSWLVARRSLKLVGRLVC